MKTFIILITLFYFCSCHSLKEQVKQENLYTTDIYAREVKGWQQQILKDTAHRYWSFFTDSTFYFHPDSGLWGNGGYMHFEDRLLSNKYHYIGASLRDSNLSTVEHIEIDKISYPKKSIEWQYLVVILLFVVGIGWLLKR